MVAVLNWFQMITDNQERFVQMLNEPMAGEGGGSGGGGGGGAPGTGGVPPGAESGYIQVTPDEKEAIERVRTNCNIWGEH